MNLLDSLARRRAFGSVAFAMVVAAAVAFAGGAGRWGGALLIGACGLELIQRRQARRAGGVTAAGVLYEALIDRAGEAVLCGGIALYFLRGALAPESVTFAVMTAFAALALASLAAYARARAEAAGVEAAVGLPPAMARCVALGVAPLALGIGGTQLVWMTLAYAAASAVTLVWRVVHVVRGGPSGAPRKRDTLPGRATVLRKGH